MGVTSMEKVRELVPSLSAAWKTTEWRPVWAAAGVHEKAPATEEVPAAALKTAPEGRAEAQSERASPLGSVAVTASWTRLL